MASLTFRDFDLNQTSITGKRNPNVQVDAFRPRYKMDKETQERTEELEGYIIDILARNRVQSVKLPLEAVTEATAKQIQNALSNRKIVTVNFGANASTLRGRCYALLNSGRLLSGVSCTASELNIVSIEDAEDDLDELAIEI